jgi:hypothetical protein
MTRTLCGGVPRSSSSVATEPQVVEPDRPEPGRIPDRVTATAQVVWLDGVPRLLVKT